MNPVEQTIYSDLFDEVKNNSIFVLDEFDAANYWELAISQKAKSFFRLQNDNWLVTKNNLIIGNWIEAYNHNDNEYVSEILVQSIDWERDSTIRFYISKTIILETKWDCFLEHWDCFLAIEDDCPIVIKEGDERTRGLIFTPLGQIIMVN